MILCSGIDLAYFAGVLWKLFSNLSSSNFSSSVQHFSNFSSWTLLFSSFSFQMLFFPFKKGTSSQPLFGFPIFQVGVHKVPVFQVKYLILTSLKKGTRGQPLFGFPIFQVLQTDFCSGSFKLRPTSARSIPDYAT